MRFYVRRIGSSYLFLPLYVRRIESNYLFLPLFVNVLDIVNDVESLFKSESWLNILLRDLGESIFVLNVKITQR